MIMKLHAKNPIINGKRSYYKKQMLLKMSIKSPASFVLILLICLNFTLISLNIQAKIPASGDAVEYPNVGKAETDGWLSGGGFLSVDSDRVVGDYSLKSNGIAGISYGSISWKPGRLINLAGAKSLTFYLKYDYGSTYPPIIVLKLTDNTYKQFELLRYTGFQKWDKVTINLKDLVLDGYLSAVEIFSVAFDNVGEYIMIDGLYFDNLADDDISEYSTPKEAEIYGWSGESTASVLDLSVDTDCVIGNYSLKSTGVDGQGQYGSIIWEPKITISLDEKKSINFYLKHNYGSTYPPYVQVCTTEGVATYTLPRYTGYQKWDNVTIELDQAPKGKFTRLSLYNVAFDDKDEYIKIDGLHFSDGKKTDWHFDENDSSYTYDSIDNSAGILVNMNSSSWTSGRLGNALSFDGDNDYIKIYDKSCLDITGNMTIEGWLKPATESYSNGPAGIITKRILGYLLPLLSDKTGYMFSIASNNLIFEYGNGLTVETITSDQYNFDADKWYHIAVTYDCNCVKFYVNGNLLSVHNATLSSIAPNDKPLFIGGGPDNALITQSSFCGVIDEISIYDIVLNSAEINKLYIAGGGDNAFGCEANPTGNPIGGGEGYSDIVSEANATYVINNYLMTNPVNEDAVEYNTLQAAMQDGWKTSSVLPEPQLSLETDSREGNLSLKATGVDGQGNYGGIVWEPTYEINLTGVKSLHFWLKYEYGSTYPPYVQIYTTEGSKTFTLPRYTGFQQWEEVTLDLRREVSGNLIKLAFFNVAFDAKDEYIMIDGLYFSIVELLNVLPKANSGDAIYIEDSLQIDLTGMERFGDSALRIPAGVVLASGRGQNGSPGALIYANSGNEAPGGINLPFLFQAGDHARITGLRFRGPDATSGPQDAPYEAPALGCISGNIIEVDNCEISEFPQVGVAGGGGSYIHHNYFHHILRTRLGWAVCVGEGEEEATVLVEANKFDWCRHCIASAGNLNCSYEARYNLILENISCHSFDVHGEIDRRVDSLKGIWRFEDRDGNLGLGEDSSLSTANHGTLMNMDINTCVINGKVGRNALLFDGNDDYIEILDDSSLALATFTVEGWFKCSSQQNNATILSKGGTNGSWDLYVLSLDGRLAFQSTDGTNTYQINSDGQVTDNQWHYFAIECVQGNHMKMYVDGVLQQDSSSASSSEAFYGNLLIGKSTNTNNYFKGAVDDVRIYNNIIDPSEIYRHASSVENSDLSGNTIIIHHNTFKSTNDWAFVIRGIAHNKNSIFNNWFYHKIGYGIKQHYATGNHTDAFLNLYRPERVLVDREIMSE